MPTSLAPHSIVVRSIAHGREIELLDEAVADDAFAAGSGRAARWKVAGLVVAIAAGATLGTVAASASWTGEATPAGVSPAPSSAVSSDIPLVSVSDLPSASTDRRADETAMVEAIRAASSSNRPSEALRLLEQYRTAFPSGELEEETHVLRIEALVCLGRTADALTLANRFLWQRPQSPYWRRVRAIVSRLGHE